MLHMQALSLQLVEGVEGDGGRVGGWVGETHGIKEQRVMSELPGLVPAGPPGRSVEAELWCVDVLQCWTPVPMSFFFFFLCFQIFQGFL